MVTFLPHSFIMTWCVNISGVYGETKLLKEYKLNTILNVITSFCITDTQDNYGREKTECFPWR